MAQWLCIVGRVGYPEARSSPYGTLGEHEDAAAVFDPAVHTWNYLRSVWDAPMIDAARREKCGY